ncbi:MAG: hypothetical protein ACI9OJ_004775, partial [Myxococcota bacterium]
TVRELPIDHVDSKQTVGAVLVDGAGFAVPTAAVRLAAAGTQAARLATALAGFTN